MYLNSSQEIGRFQYTDRKYSMIKLYGSTYIMLIVCNLSSLQPRPVVQWEMIASLVATQGDLYLVAHRCHALKIAELQALNVLQHVVL